jgi:hypothetical protein
VVTLGCSRLQVSPSQPACHPPTCQTAWTLWANWVRFFQSYLRAIKLAREPW